MRKTLARLLSALLLLFAASMASAAIWDTVPDEQLKALQLDRSATPKQLFDALSKRWEANLNKGKFAKCWEPIAFTQYMAPSLFTSPRPDIVSTRGVRGMPQPVTHGWVKSWEKSVHARLEEIRTLRKATSGRTRNPSSPRWRKTA